MKKIFSILCLIIALTHSASIMAAKPRRVIVFSGGGAQAAMFLGMLDGAEQFGWEPDVIIGACGGSIAATIASLFKTSKERYDFVLSKPYYDILQQVTLRDTSINPFIFLHTLFQLRLWMFQDVIPTFTHRPLYQFGSKFISPYTDLPFNGPGPKAVTIASRLMFDPYDQKVLGQDRNGRDLYEQVLFTDEDTAEEIGAFKAPVAIDFPDSAILENARVLTGYTIGDGIRTSISDPLLINPPLVKGDYFVGAPIDMFPIELAEHLGDEVIMMYNKGLLPFEHDLVSATYRFDYHQRMQSVTSQNNVYRWIDLTEREELEKNGWFDATVDVKEMRLVTGIPADPEEFNRKVRAQYEFGKKRAIESFSQMVGSKHHIRNMDSSNTSKDQLKIHGRAL